MIEVKVIQGDYCECGCKGKCDTRKVVLIKNGIKQELSIYYDLADFIKIIGLDNFQIIKLKK